MVVEKETAEKETAWPRQELQDLQTRFAAQKEDLEADHQKQVDDMFFYGYWCCMKKHDIANDTHNFPYDDGDDEFLGGLAQGDRPTPGDRHALGGRPSTEDDSHGE